jgi:DNA-binding NarL/FixJ family response regulator
VRTIVLVDDDREFCLILRALLLSLRQSVSVVGEAGDGEEGLAVMRRERPDILITDLVMPNLNGIELTRHIRRELPQTGIILISSHTDDAYRLMASDSGADSFVNKSVISTALVAAVRDIVARLDGETFPHTPPGQPGGGYGG